MQNATPAAVAVLVLELIPAAVFGLAGERVGRACARWPSTLRTALPVLCALPYVLISFSHQMFSWKWCVLYAALPVAIAWLLGQAAIADPEQRGNWRDAIVLLTLGLAVDLRWFEPAWPTGLRAWGNCSWSMPPCMDSSRSAGSAGPALTFTSIGAIGKPASGNWLSLRRWLWGWGWRSAFSIPMATRRGSR